VTLASPQLSRDLTGAQENRRPGDILAESKQLESLLISWTPDLL
jgi:hypothetical protein